MSKNIWTVNNQLRYLCLKVKIEVFFTFWIDLDKFFDNWLSKLAFSSIRASLNIKTLCLSCFQKFPVFISKKIFFTSPKCGIDYVKKIFFHHLRRSISNNFSSKNDKFTNWVTYKSSQHFRYLQRERTLKKGICRRWSEIIILGAELVLSRAKTIPYLVRAILR